MLLMMGAAWISSLSDPSLFDILLEISYAYFLTIPPSTMTLLLHIFGIALSLVSLF